MLRTKFRKYFSLSIFLLSLNIAKAQLGKEAWHWQFGDSCSLDFSSGIPVAGKSSINTTEGCASISDPNTGQLLFYTNGTKVWDKNNNQMPNGFGMIGGQGTSTQAALIVPKPGSATTYYLISADQGGYMGPNQGVNYSIVDMSLNSGLGDVTIKNQILTPPPTTEKLTAVKHCNGTDYWIIIHPFNSNAFNVYLLNSSGINITPIISNTGTVQSNFSGNYGETIGYLKASPNGKKLACAIHQMDILEIFDFDNSNGQVNNPITIKYGYPYLGFGAYGVAFSPDNSKLYSTRESGSVFQYDLSSNNASTIITSQVNLSDSVLSDLLGAVQLAPDGKIYLSIQNSSRLAVISYPNKLGVSCNFNLHGPVLSTAVECKSGLPNFIEASNDVFFHQSYNTFLCSFPSYILNAAINNTNYLWLNGDTTKNTTINTFGNYWVSYINSQGCKEIDTSHVVQTQAPVINILHDTAQCSNLVTQINLNATYTNTTSYLWNDNSTSPVSLQTNPNFYS